MRRIKIYILTQYVDVRGRTAHRGLKLRRLRKAASISQAELANRMGVDRAYVSGLELGQRNPTIVTLWHVAKALDVDFNEIFGSSRGKPRGQKPTEQRAEF